VQEGPLSAFLDYSQQSGHRSLKEGACLERSKYQVKDECWRLLIAASFVRYPYELASTDQSSLQLKSVLQ
jgi:hypothetical protein